MSKQTRTREQLDKQTYKQMSKPIIGKQILKQGRHATRQARR